MSTPIMTRVNEELGNKLEELSSEKHWKVSQTVREILTYFFEQKCELSENSG